MSLSDLKKMQLLRPEEEWSGKPDRSKVNRLLAMLSGAASVGGCLMMAMGDGHALTWYGLLVFAIGMGIFVAVNIRGVDAGIRSR